MTIRHAFIAFVLALSFMVTAGTARGQEITLYSGRGEPLVAPLIRQFERESGIKVKVRYADTAALAVLIQEEGDKSPADIYWGQDAGALGALAQAGLFAPLPESLTADLPDIYKSQSKLWTGTSGRSRVLAYSEIRVPENELPESVFDLPEALYSGRVGWAPTNGSFQAFVTAMRSVHGEEKTRIWLEAMGGNEVKSYRNNSALLQAIADGEIDYALVNHYYLPRFKARDESFPVAQTFFKAQDTGNMMNVAAVAILASSQKQDEARQFISFLLSPAAQQFFTSEIYEYPVQDSAIINPQLGDFETVLARSPAIRPDDLVDLEGTLNLLRQGGYL